MSPRTVCKLERFKECSKAIPKTRPWQEFCCSKHKDRFRWLMERRRRRARLNRKLANARTAHASILNWGAPASDASHSAAVAYNVYRSGTSGGPLTDPTGRSMPLSLPA
jgi:hypothetical protein